MPVIFHRDTVFTIRSVLSSQYCEELIQLSEQKGYQQAEINSAQGMVLRKDVRNNSRILYDSAELASDLWERIREDIPQQHTDRTVVGLNERLRFYRYQSGQKFDWHYDGAYQRNNGERSLFTVMFYLNDGFIGGETSFSDIDIIPRRGNALVFWHHQLHCGQELVEGQKYVLRTDIMYSAIG